MKISIFTERRSTSTGSRGEDRVLSCRRQWSIFHALKENGKVIRGSEEHKEQAKYNVELVYIQDQDMIENQEDAGLGLNCPNCGAPLPGLGAKKCIYCDTPIVEYNLRVWIQPGGRGIEKAKEGLHGEKCMGLKNRRLHCQENRQGCGQTAG